MRIDKKDIKPITDILGYAVLDSQKLEYSIAYMMLLADNEFDLTDKQQDEKIDDYMLNLSKKTLGGLISQLKKLIEVNDRFAERLEEALDARNYLIHRFINQEGEKFLTIKGREEALQIVKEKREILYQCYFFLDPFIQKLMELRGFSHGAITKELLEKYERGDK
ncbi:hypothetical protein [Pontibacter harenae]|uniref:hypothetical protein n=1 Tax=Pontibacter harenae TaxID=2894083 RepID=UPI001E28CAB3|nr:hypothetical protein [Pontibacter harenae]MCC9168298.1 hypothetical protein [Pontibacter harenae]